MNYLRTLLGVSTPPQRQEEELATKQSQPNSTTMASNLHHAPTNVSMDQLSSARSPTVATSVDSSFESDELTKASNQSIDASPPSPLHQLPKTNLNKHISVNTFSHTPPSSAGDADEPTQVDGVVAHSPSKLDSSNPNSATSTATHESSSNTDIEQSASASTTANAKANSPTMMPSNSTSAASSSTSTHTASSSSSASPSSSLSTLWLTLLRIRECFVYRVPPRVGLIPYQAESWGLDKPLAVCELLVSACEAILVIRLINSQNDGEGKSTLFAQSVELNCLPSDGKCVPLESFCEPTRDSSRYFVIRVKDPRTGAVQSLGIGFRERVSAFDLNAALQDRLKSVRRHAELDVNLTSTNKDGLTLEEQNALEVALAESRLQAYHEKDYSLMPGERITIKLKSASNASKSISEKDDRSKGKAKSKSKSHTTSPNKAPVAITAENGRMLLAPPPPPSTIEPSPTHSTVDDYPSESPSHSLSAVPTNLSPTHSPRRVGHASDNNQTDESNSHPTQTQLTQADTDIPANDNEEDEFTDFTSAQ